MRIVRVILSILALAVSTSAFAEQRHAVDPRALAAAVEQHAAGQDADRLAVIEALKRPEVRAVASAAGIDYARVTASVDSLKPVDLAKAAASARQVNDALVGGATTVVITTTTIIIILLVVILIAVL